MVGSDQCCNWCCALSYFSCVGAVGGMTTPGGKSVRFSDGTRPKHPEEMPTTPPPPSRINRLFIII